MCTGAWRRDARRLGAAVLAAVGLLASTALAEELRVACTARLVGRRVVARPEVSSLVAPELERLMRLGLAGRLEVELTLRRRRALWFDERVDGARLTQVLGYAPGEGVWLLDERPVGAALRTLELERVAWVLETLPRAEDVLHVEVRVRLQVVTAASLEKVAKWLTRHEATDADRSALTQRLLLTVAEDLARQAEARCPVLPSHVRTE